MEKSFREYAATSPQPGLHETLLRVHMSIVYSTTGVSRLFVDWAGGGVSTGNRAESPCDRHGVFTLPDVLMRPLCDVGSGEHPLHFGSHES